MKLDKKPLHVVLLGPDGSGKSSVAQALIQRPGLAFEFRSLHRWTLGILPPLEAIVDWLERRGWLKRPEPASPQGRHAEVHRPLPAWLSGAIVSYHALDMALARISLRRMRGRAGLVLFDRSFLDFLVLPGHAAVPRWFMRLCWAAVAKPDLVLYLDRDPAAIYRDKPELTEQEIERQQRAIETLISHMPQALRVDARHGLAATVDRVCAVVDAQRLAGTAPTALDHFEAQVQANPQAIALDIGGQAWSYEALHAHARAAAAALHDAGMRRGDVVVVHGPRGAANVAGLLGTWMTGGIVLLLDAASPLARCSQLWKAASARWLISTSHEPPEWAPPAACVAWPRGAPALPARATGRLPPRSAGVSAGTGKGMPTAHGPAYLCFTSGTTGQPKGVIGSHEGLAHFLDWQRSRFAIGPGDRVAHVTHLGFDVVLREMLVPLVSGATLVVPDPDDQWPDRLLPWMAAAGATVLHAVPSLASRWLAATEPARRGCPSLRLTLFAGEPLGERLVRAWRQAHPAATIANLYGPTETTLAKFAAVVPDPPAAGVQAVGQPLPGCRAWVLDEAGHPCPPGVAGEVMIATPHRSLGLLGADTLERCRFDVNPATGDPLDIVFRSGDRGMLLPDGSLQVLGRLDTQLKVRGVRVEPAEVEAVISRQPGVRQAVVVGVEGPAGDTELAAYIVPDDPPPRLECIHAALRDALPAALRPSYLALVPEVALTERGKLDRRRLPPLHATEAAATTEPGRPGPAAAVQLQGIWGEILGHGHFGPDSNFFSVGGDSIKALMLALRVAALTGRPPQADWVYEHPALSAQAGWLQDVAAGLSGRGSMQPMTFGAGRPRRLVALPPMLGYGLVYHRLARHLPDHEIVAFDFPVQGNPVAAYMQAIPDDGRPLVLLGYSAGGNLAFEVARHWEALGRTVDRVIMLDTNRWEGPERATERLPDAEIEAIVQANLGQLKALFEADEHFARYVARAESMAAMAVRMRAFLRFERDCRNTGRITADIHLIHSEQFGPCLSWAQATRGLWTVHAGRGQHLQMLHGETARENAQAVLAALSGRGPAPQGASQPSPSLAESP